MRSIERLLFLNMHAPTAEKTGEGRLKKSLEPVKPSIAYTGRRVSDEAVRKTLRVSSISTLSRLVKPWSVKTRYMVLAMKPLYRVVKRNRVSPVNLERLSRLTSLVATLAALVSGGEPLP